MIRDKNKIYAEENDRNTVCLPYAINVDYTELYFVSGSENQYLRYRWADIIEKAYGGIVICKFGYGIPDRLRTMGLSKPNSILVTDSTGNLTYKEVSQ